MFKGIVKNLMRIVLPFIGLSVRDRMPDIWKTFIFNFLAFGIKGVFKLPVIVYRNTNIYKIGKIVLHCAMQKGLIKIGKLDYKSQGETRFFNTGTINIHGPVRIEGATIIENSGVITFDGYNRISDGSTILVRSKLKFGKHSRLGFHGFIMDSDDHYTVDVENRKVSKKCKPIQIGAYNWFGNSTIIKKGVVTPDYLIVASANALLTKDYSSLPPYTVMGGMPAKVLKSGIRRVFNADNERMINKYFKDNPDANEFVVDGDVNLDDYCASSQNIKIL